MPDEFDPYLAWLGIPTTARPPSHYQLLGVMEFESDAARIAAAADERMAEVRSFQTGPRGKYTQKILNELAAAKLCLLDARAKEDYDASLIRQRVPATAAVPQPMAVVYVPIEAPPAAIPPASPPPVPPPATRAKTATGRAPIEEPDAEPREFSGWWYVVGLFFVIVIISAGVAVYYRPPPPAPPPVNEEEVVQLEPPEKKAVRPDPQAEPLVIVQEGSGDLSFPASIAELSEDLQRREEAGESVIEGWQPNTSVARWRFKIVRPAVFQVRMVYAAQQAEGAEWQLRVGEDTKTRDVKSSSESEPLVTDEFFWRVARGGENTFELSLTSLPTGASVTLKSVRFIFQPGGKLQ